MIKAEKRATIIKGINQSIKESCAGCGNSPSNYYLECYWFDGYVKTKVT